MIDVSYNTILILIYLYALNTILGVVYGILTRPGELLAPLAIYIKSKQFGVFNKLLLCPYCLFGQLTLWQFIVIYYFIATLPIALAPILIGLTIISIKSWLNNL